MKILFSSYSFSPSIGGIESVSALLAERFAKAGHEVQLVTETAQRDQRSWPFEVHRQPRFQELISLTRWCDLEFHNNISLRAAWPLLSVRRPLVIAHQTWITRTDGSRGWMEYLKRFLLNFASNIAISRSIAEALPVRSDIIGNPYEESVFVEETSQTRNKDLVYLGRLVSDKGVNLLLEALFTLKGQGLSPSLTIIGSGPEEPALREMVSLLHLGEQVDFAGSQSGSALASMLNRHKIMVVPSRWAEPFGIVALEGIACGCVVVGSEAGGLPDAIGPCGVTVPNANASALAAALRNVLTDDLLVRRLRDAASGHLSKFKPARVAAAYLEVFQRAIR